MKVEIKKLVGWDEVFDSAMFTQRKESDGKIPSENWKKKTCVAQHSVLRDLRFSIKLYDAPNFVITHLIRHTKASPQPFVATQREDLTGIPSEEVGRLTPNNLKFDINGEALLFMAQQRLCFKASKETLDHAVLLRRVRRDELLAKPVVAARLAEPPALEDQSVIGANHRRLTLRPQASKPFDACLLERPLCFLRTSSKSKRYRLRLSRI